jgi:putative ABC transport system ATP-binding protein
MIELNDVSVAFDDAGETVRAVDHVTFHARPNEFVLISGASGSGKSTLLNAISGLQPIDGGQCITAGVDVSAADDRALAKLRLEHVGVVFQDNNLIREFNASENVQVSLRARGYSRGEAARESIAVLERVGLAGLERRTPTRLSGGQRQRVGIARAVVGGRSVLVADEPTGALDTANSRAIFALLRGLADVGVCVVVASHDPAAAAFADRTLLMRDGDLVEKAVA